MNVKAALAHDARTVFCNPDEFGETSVLDGITTVAVMSNAVTAVTDTMLDNPFAVRPQVRVSVCASDFPAGYPKGMDRYVPNIENIILFADSFFVNILKNIRKDSML